MIKEAMFSHEEFMEKLGLDGEFEAIRNIIVSMTGPAPRIEVVYHSSETSTRDVDE